MALHVSRDRYNRIQSYRFVPRKLSPLGSGEAACRVVSCRVGRQRPHAALRSCVLCADSGLHVRHHCNVHARGHAVRVFAVVPVSCHYEYGFGVDAMLYDRPVQQPHAARLRFRHRVARAMLQYLGYSEAECLSMPYALLAALCCSLLFRLSIARICKLTVLYY